MLHTEDQFPQTDGDHDSKATNEYLRQILQNSSEGTSNVFLVDATDVHSAIAASFSVLVGSRSADEAVPENKPDPTRRGRYWLVVYLGSGPSSPTWWTIEEAAVESGKVVVSYRMSKPRPATDDIHRYYYWIPLGKLDPGTYQVELFDSASKTVRLMRCVEVIPTQGTGGVK